MIVTRKTVWEAKSLPQFIALLREEATWHDDGSVTWLLLTRAAEELEKRDSK